jgi:tetratricopeptide (TPR) repeat protein
MKLRALALVTNLLAANGLATAEPHACHGMQMFDTAGLPPEPVRDGVGASEFPMTTRVPKARQLMRQGMALLHCFWHFEAYRSFLEVARLDPSSPMGYWGIYLVYTNFNGYDAQAKEQLAKAVKRIGNASEHEKYYVRAAQLLTEKDDRKGYIREMETLIDRFPDDIDARLLLALELLHGYDADGKPNEGQLYSQTMLAALLARHPDNVGANHYLVHALETSRHPESALAAAEKLPSLAPRSAHIVHMPGHIYYRIGDYAHARQAFLASMKVDEAYLAAERVRAGDDWNYPHNLAYLVATCAEDGRYAEGQRLARKLEAIAAEPAHAASAGAFMYTRAETGDFALARLQMRYGDWAAAANNPLAFPIDESHVHEQAKTYRQGLRSYIAGMAALSGGRLEEAARDANALDAALWQLQRSVGDDAPKNVRRILGLASYDLRANLVARQGQLDAAVKLMQAASKLEAEIGYSEPPPYWRPIDESLGQIYLRARKWNEASQAFTRALAARPNNGFSLSGLGAAEAGSGHVAEAARAYRALLEVWAEADANLPALLEARAWIASHPSK